MDMEKVKNFAKKHLEKNDRSHGWQHTKRVLKLCERIGEEEGADLEVLRLAALLHDVGHHRDKENHGEVSAELAKDFLDGYGKKDEVIHCITVHRFSKDREPETLEAEILQDADNLDVTGAIGIARTMMYAGENGRPIYLQGEISDSYENGKSQTSVQHLRDKSLKIKDILNTEAAKKIGAHRHEFTKDFLKELEGEYKGEI